MGHSVGHYEGNTLVIDTVGVDPRSFTDEFGTPHTDQMHVVERLRYTDATNVTYEVTIDDPVIFERPWIEKWSMQRKPSWKILENVCEDNNRCVAGNCTPADVQQTATR
jgi:hypothetical protein